MNTTKLELPTQHNAIFSGIAHCAAALGVQAYVVGGYVRDMLLGKDSKDIDVVCIGSGIALAKAVAKLFDSTVTVYENFGTAAVLAYGVELEFVGARKESYERGSRKPVVEEGTLLDDLTRRDFTFNALAVSLHPDTFGELIDMFGGVKDLSDGILRTPTDPNVTFSDDPLRMLRAIRFSARFGFGIDGPTTKGIMDNIQRMSIVSAERILKELDGIMRTKAPQDAFRLMNTLGLEHYLFPELTALAGVQVIDGQAHKDNYLHSLVVLEHAVALTDDVRVRWASLFHDIGKARTKLFQPSLGWTFHNHEEVGAKMVGKMLNRLKMPHDDIDFITKLVALHGRPMQMAGNVTDSAVRRIMFDAGKLIDPLMVLVRSDYSTTQPHRIQRHLRYCDVTQEKMVELEAKDSMLAFRPAINGDEIMQIFMLKQGPVVGNLKKAMTEAILDGAVGNTYEELLPWLHNAYKEVVA